MMNGFKSEQGNLSETNSKVIREVPSFYNIGHSFLSPSDTLGVKYVDTVK